MSIPENFTIEKSEFSCFTTGQKYIKLEVHDEMIPSDPVRSAAYVISDESRRELNPDRRFIFIVRHGETDWNVAGRFQGREDNPINEKGERQAVHCGNMIHKSIEKNNITIADGKVFSSPLKRANKTAQIISEICGINISEVTAVEGFVERDYGPLSGLTSAERKEKFNGIRTEDVEGIEKMQDTGNRFFEAFQNLCGENPEKNLLIVSHGGVLNAFVNMCTGAKIGTGVTLTTNCCVNIISDYGGKFTLEAFNLTPIAFGEYQI